MKLLVINGSPRGEEGATAMLTGAFIRGARTSGVTVVETLNLRQAKDDIANRAAFEAADAVILAYPLYIDAMPALTKQFIETLLPLRGPCRGKRLGFIVQSGFPEACQSRAVEHYNEKLARRLGCTYAGCVIRGNCNRLELQPKLLTRSLFRTFEQLGVQFASDGVFDKVLIQKLAAPERLGAFALFMMRILEATPLTSLFWDRELRKNGVFKQRDRQPYLDLATENWAAETTEEF